MGSMNCNNPPICPLVVLRLESIYEGCFPQEFALTDIKQPPPKLIIRKNGGGSAIVEPFYYFCNLKKQELGHQPIDNSVVFKASKHE